MVGEFVDFALLENVDTKSKCAFLQDPLDHFSSPSLVPCNLQFSPAFISNPSRPNSSIDQRANDSMDDLGGHSLIPQSVSITPSSPASSFSSSIIHHKSIFLTVDGT
jgi:hypothetical protein